MTEKAQNKNLNQAKTNKKDEFYTQLSDIEEETNGIYTYDREICKIDPDTLRKWNRALKEAGECKTYADHPTDH